MKRFSLIAILLAFATGLAVADEKKDKKGLAKGILGWFKLKTYDLTPAQKKKNRKWWDDLTKYGDFWQKIMLEGIGKKEGGKPSDQDIARMYEIKRLSFDDEHKVHDVTPLKDFMALTYLSFQGDVETLDPLKKIPDLKKVMVNIFLMADLPI